MNIYISKSNECNQETVTHIRQLITSSGNEAVEYKQGTPYNPELIKSCERIILIPPAVSKISGNTIVVGRGIYGEIYDNIAIRSYIFLSDNKFHRITGGDKVDEGKSWKEYGYLQYLQETISFEDILKELKVINTLNKT